MITHSRLLTLASRFMYICFFIFTVYMHQCVPVDKTFSTRGRMKIIFSFFNFSFYFSFYIFTKLLFMKSVHHYPHYIFNNAFPSSLHSSYQITYMIEFYKSRSPPTPTHAGCASDIKLLPL